MRSGFHFAMYKRRSAGWGMTWRGLLSLLPSVEALQFWSHLRQSSVNLDAVLGTDLFLNQKVCAFHSVVSLQLENHSVLRMFNDASVAAEQLLRCPPRTASRSVRDRSKHDSDKHVLQGLYGHPFRKGQVHTTYLFERLQNTLQVEIIRKALDGSEGFSGVTLLHTNICIETRY